LYPHIHPSLHPVYVAVVRAYGEAMDIGYYAPCYVLRNCPLVVSVHVPTVFVAALYAL